MKRPKLRELKEAIISLFSPAYTTKFPFEEHYPAKNYRGKPVVDNENCVGCETCANVCPSKAITFYDDAEKGVRIMSRDFGKCIFCGQCEEHCITGKGVKLSDTIFDLACFDKQSLVEKQEKELVICKNCGAVITTKEHLHFIHYKLGPKAFASMLQLQALNEELQFEEPEDVGIDIVDELKRKDFFNILCPDCLHKIQIKLYGK